jgi:hypothetical protein
MGRIEINIKLWRKKNYMEEEKTKENNIKINFKGVGWNNMNFIM